MKNKLVIRGFFGKGNCGDEAILQTLFDFFSPTFDIVISTDLKGIDEEWLYKMHPYNKSMIIHCEDRSIFKQKDVSGFLLGGGGFGNGFGFNQFAVARRAGKKIIHAGTHIDAGFFKGIFQNNNVDQSSGFGDVGGFFAINDTQTPTDKKYNEAMKSFLNLADYTAVRNMASHKVCEYMGVKALYRPDWVFGLQKDTCGEIQKDWRRMIVVIREYGQQHEDLVALKTWMQKIKSYAGKLGMYIKFLPFCNEDSNYLRKHGLYNEGEVIDGEFWNPRRAKQWIANSGMVVTMGRFHPVVFAISEGVPVISVDYNFDHYRNKGCVLMEDSCLGQFVFNKKDELRDVYDLFKEAMSDKNKAKVASIGATNTKLVLRMKDEILKILTTQP